MLNIRLGKEFEVPEVQADGKISTILHELLTAAGGIYHALPQKAGDEFLRVLRKAVCDPEAPYFDREKPPEGVMTTGAAAALIQRLSRESEK